MLWDIIFELMAYHVGYAFLKLVSCGRYPREYVKGGSFGATLVGLTVMLGAIGLIVLLLRG